MIYPLYFMIFITFFITMRLLFIGTYLVVTKQIHIKQFRLTDGEFPSYALNARDHFRNMFEIPILFYILCILFIINDSYAQIDIYLAWGFVIFRLLHTIVRIPNRDVLLRFTFFVISLLFLISGWVRMILQSF